MVKLKVVVIIYIDIYWDGIFKGFNIEVLRELVIVVSILVIVFGGISLINDLLNLLVLEIIGVKGVIVGCVLYIGGISFKEVN